jgi:hypothetical protein
MENLSEIIIDLKNLNWNKILELCNGLEDLNDRQWRFIKGFIIEIIIEELSGEQGLTYVGEDHRDFIWNKHNISVELKSATSGSMYGKRGSPNKNFTLKFNNSNCTNKAEELNPDHVADILLAVYNNGSFIVGKETVIKNAKHSGDGWEVILSRDDIIEISGKIDVSEAVNLNFKESITNAIRSEIKRKIQSI